MRKRYGDKFKSKVALEAIKLEEYINFIMGSAHAYIEGQKSCKRIGRVKNFLKWLRNNRDKELKSYPFGKSRRVITDILIANDLYREKVNNKDNHFPLILCTQVYICSPVNYPNL